MHTQPARQPLCAGDLVRAAAQPLLEFQIMDFKSLEKRALDHPAQDRAKLAQELLESLDTLRPAEREQLWLDEAERRARQLDAGEVALVPGDEVARKAHKLLR